jgi:hypothetical protein
MPRLQVSQLLSKTKGISDVIFLLDSSGSMQPVFDSLIRHIQSFVEGVHSNSQIIIDWRIGFLAADEDQFVAKDFCTDVDDFVKALGRVRSHDSDEFTLPALDFAADFRWREKVHKIIFLFSDEPIRQGHRADFQESRMPELMKKLTELQIKLIIRGVECPVFRRLSANVPRAEYAVAGGHFEMIGEDFSNLMFAMGKSVSMNSTGSQFGHRNSTSPDLYGLRKTRLPKIVWLP